MENKSLSVGPEPVQALNAEGVWKTYDGNHYILKDITFRVREKEMILITGRSGSGKTTLLNLLGCMDVPSKGRIRLNGYDTGMMTQRQLARARLERIGMIFQSHNLIGDLTVLENVMLPLKIAGNKGARERAQELLKAFDLTNYMQRFPSEISGGERQRVAVARALANSPTVLLADEPTASLDIDNCNMVIDAFKKANKEFGATIVIASHDPIMGGHVSEIFYLERGTLKGEQ
jgi:ABC-type lipoprotein export system ATPase subunit